MKNLRRPAGTVTQTKKPGRAGFGILENGAMGQASTRFTLAERRDTLRDAVLL
jgi:hypothetical protein